MRTPEQWIEQLWATKETSPPTLETLQTFALLGIWKELARANRIKEFELGVEENETQEP